MRRRVISFLSAMLLTGGATANPARVGKWSVQKSPSVQYAFTQNDAGAEIGIICLMESRDCLAYIITTNQCSDGAIIPMMLNTPVGANTVQTVCRHFPADQGKVTMMNVVTEFDVLKTAMESGGTIGFAIPMQSGAFHVLRFDTAGGTLAIKEAMKLPPDVRRKEPASVYQ
jgi:hypothetical protein